ncbi:hypothetical protein [Solirhodobacter olei]|uniref:hypothetical protein n=1 Tax=Solirhodobacter olei TaxID=2493082 RepID=UPI000FD6C63D|nr:hypothetical protein [Solirhodobacter olei]
MTIAVIWQENGRQWCAADTRLVAGSEDKPTTEIATKIYAIPVVASAMDQEDHLRIPHYWTQYGFAYAGSALPATMTAVTASTLLQKLARPGDLSNPPTFEQIAGFVHRLAERFMKERRQFSEGKGKNSDDGIFSAAFFGWCPHEMKYKVAHIDGRMEAAFRVELTYPDAPPKDGDPWLVLGTAKEAFDEALKAYRRTEPHITSGLPRRAIDKMVAEGPDPTVGGATSIGAAGQNGFDLFWVAEPITPGQPQARRLFNGLDLDTEVGQIGQYLVASTGIA